MFDETPRREGVPESPWNDILRLYWQLLNIWQVHLAKNPQYTLALQGDFEPPFDGLALVGNQTYALQVRTRMLQFRAEIAARYPDYSERIIHELPIP